MFVLIKIIKHIVFTPVKVLFSIFTNNILKYIRNKSYSYIGVG